MPLAKRKHSPSPELSASVPARNLRPRKAKQSDAPAPPPPVHRPRPQVKSQYQSKAKKQRNEARKVRSSTSGTNRVVLPPRHPQRGVTRNALPPLTSYQRGSLRQHLGKALIHSTKFNKRRCEFLTHPLWTAVLQKLCNCSGLMIPVAQHRITAPSNSDPASSGKNGGNIPDAPAMAAKKNGESEENNVEVGVRSPASDRTDSSVPSTAGRSFQTSAAEQVHPAPRTTSSVNQLESIPVGNASQATILSDQPPSSNPTHALKSISASSLETEPAQHGAWTEMIPDFSVLLMGAALRKDIDLGAIFRSKGYDPTNSSDIAGILQNDTQLLSDLFAIPLIVELKRSTTRHPDNIEQYTTNFSMLRRTSQVQAIQQSICLFHSHEYKHQGTVMIIAAFGEWWSFCEMTRELLVQHDLPNNPTSPNEDSDDESTDSDDDDYFPPGAPAKTKVTHSRQPSLSQADIDTLNDLNDNATHPYRDRDVNQCFKSGASGQNESPIINNDKFYIRNRRPGTWTPCMRLGSDASNQAMEYIGKELDRLSKLKEQHFFGES